MTATGRATPTDPAGTTANPTPGDDCGRCSPVNAASTNWPTIAPPPCTCNPWPTPRTPATSSPNRYGISPTRSGSRKGKRLAAPPHSPGRRRSTFGSPKASTSATLSTHLPSCWPATQDPDPDPVHPCGTRPGPYTRLRLGRLGADAPPDHREIDAVEQHFGSGVATEAHVHQPVVLTAGDAAHATEHTEHTDGLHRLHLHTRRGDNRLQRGQRRVSHSAIVNRCWSASAAGPGRGRAITAGGSLAGSRSCTPRPWSLASLGAGSAEPALSVRTVGGRLR